MGRRLDIEKLMDLVKSNKGNTGAVESTEVEKDLFCFVC